MPIHFKKFSRSIVPRLMLTVGVTLLVSLSVWAYLDLHYPPGRQPTDILVRAASIFVFTTGVIFIWILYFVQRPIRHLIDGTRLIAEGKYTAVLAKDHDDEMGQLAAAINQMGKEIGKNQMELNRQRNEYQTLFELVPCIITVQDRDYRLIQYNREFAENFAPNPGDYCYAAYKGRGEKCVVCPVEKTFANGKSHYSEETGFNQDGTPAHWIVNTSPIKNDKGDIVAVIEMNLDITERKQ
ncbi:MAG: PAS domain-containing protein, partial [Candidatus Aminicenantes bacterium]|nr:PAS domain-containing protein [Candidatus Aminicenantes bacterium]